MAKRIASVALALLMILSISATAVSTRTADVQPTLTFQGTTAKCSLTVYGDNGNDRISATIELRQGNTVVDSWSTSGSGWINWSGSASVTRGRTYTLVINVTINGTEYSPISISRTCS